MEEKTERRKKEPSLSRFRFLSVCLSLQHTHRQEKTEETTPVWRLGWSYTCAETRKEEASRSCLVFVRCLEKTILPRTCSECLEGEGLGCAAEAWWLWLNYSGSVYVHRKYRGPRRRRRSRMHARAQANYSSRVICVRLSRLQPGRGQMRVQMVFPTARPGSLDVHVYV